MTSSFLEIDTIEKNQTPPDSEKKSGEDLFIDETTEEKSCELEEIKLLAIDNDLFYITPIQHKPSEVIDHLWFSHSLEPEPRPPRAAFFQNN